MSLSTIQAWQDVDQSESSVESESVNSSIREKARAAMIELPPMPKPNDGFDAPNGYTRPSYADALLAWERVCMAIIAKVEIPKDLIELKGPTMITDHAYKPIPGSPHDYCGERTAERYGYYCGSPAKDHVDLSIHNANCSRHPSKDVSQTAPCSCGALGGVPTVCTKDPNTCGVNFCDHPRCL